MKKNVFMIVAVPLMAVILIVIIVLKATGNLETNSGTRIGFVGSSTFHKYEGSYAKISGKFSHGLTPSKDATKLHCEIKTSSGELTVEIVNRSTKETILTKTVSGNEEFDVPADGKVTVRLTTNGHTGSYKFTY